MKAKVDLSQPMAEITFRCAPCKLTFKVPPARVDPDPEAEHHPFTYFAPCPTCKAECGQAGYEKALMKAWANATGPVTPAGKEATAKNLEGHPTAEESLRTRFNAMKHGLNARTAKYFPARPDGYAFCKGCDVDRAWCAQQPCCTRQTQLFMLHHAAFETRDPKHLTGMYADFQAAVFSLLQQIVSTIIGDGVTIRAPQYYTDDDGQLIIAKYIDDTDDGKEKIIYDLQAHPLFKALGEILSRNNLTLGDMGMTTKVIELEHEELGRLESQKEGRQLLGDFMQSQSRQLSVLEGFMKNAAEKRERDPVLIVFKQNEG